MDENTLQALAQHPFILEIEEKRALETIEQRKAWAAQRESLVAEKEATLPEMIRVADEKKAAYHAAQKAADEALWAANRAKLALMRAGDAFNRQVTALENEMIATASPVIDEAIGFFREKFYALCNPGHIQKIVAEGRFSLIRLKYLPGERESNVEAVRAAMDYCRGAIEALEQMRLLPEPDMAAIEALGAGLPGIDKFVVYEEPKPFQDVKGRFLPPTLDTTEILKRRHLNIRLG